MAVGAKGNPAFWVPVLVHESCHMDQWIEDKKRAIDNSYANGSLYDWMIGKKKLGKNQLKKVIENIIMYELDCEKQSIEKLKKWDVPISLDIYIQKANTVLYSYLYMMETRYSILSSLPQPMWIQAWNRAPKEFQDEYTTIPKEVREIFDLHMTEKEFKNRHL